MGLKTILIFSCFVFYFLFFVNSIEAKTLPQSKQNSGKQTTSVKQSTGTGINVSPVVRKDKKALVVYFSNLQNAKEVSYVLTYATREQQEGAMGSLNLNGSSKTSVELLFGTCSKNICRYHAGIANMKLEVTYRSSAGKKYIKRYRIKI